MESNKIIIADLLDIIFEGKNKEYGAYELRKTYNRRMIVAMVTMAGVCLIFFLAQIWATPSEKKTSKLSFTEVDLANFKKPEQAVPQPVKINIPKVKPAPVAIIKFATIKIVRDIDVKDPPPEIDKLNDTKIGLNSQDGVKDEGFVAPPVEEKGTGKIDLPQKVEDYEKAFTKVEKEARFPGGAEAWKKYLERNLNGNVAADDGAPTGRYTVKVQFIVDKEGNISEVKAIEVPSACPGCGKEAVKVIKDGPKWEPAVQNDRKVNYQAVQFVTFDVAAE